MAAWAGVTRWLGPESVTRISREDDRIWRWSEADDQALRPGWQPGDDTPDQRARTDIASLAPGFLEPGLGLFTAQGGPVCAVGRHARLTRSLKRVEQMLLMPSDSRGSSWAPLGLGTSEQAGGMTLRDAAGNERARLSVGKRWLGGLLSSGELAGRTLQCGTQSWHLQAKRASRFGSVTCLQLVDEKLGTTHAEAQTEGGRALEGRATDPLHVRWEREPDLWWHGALLWLLSLWIDQSFPDEGGPYPGIVIERRS